MDEPEERITDEDVDRIARDFITRHGSRASVLAIEQINRCIDNQDWDGRDAWARIVRRIHQLSAKS